MTPPLDPNVEAVRSLLRSRADTGFRKYGVATDRTDIDLRGWLRHAQEEALDLAVYLERIQRELEVSTAIGTGADRATLDRLAAEIRATVDVQYPARKPSAVRRACADIGLRLVLAVCALTLSAALYLATRQ